LSVELTPAFILHHRPYRETSLILDVFTRSHGRVSLVARGVRQRKKSQTHLYRLYQPLLLSWRGYGELQTMVQAEAEQGAYALQGNASLCGLYLNELLIRLLALHEAEPDLFDDYRDALSQLQQQSLPDQLVLRLFEKKLLQALGYGLQLTHNSQTGAEIVASQKYVYHPDSGARDWQIHDTYPAIHGHSLLALHHETDFDDSQLLEIKQLMRTVINYYLGGKPLKSRQLFADLKRYASPKP
jgi:DNA repair protein RecO (recombination protein O)